MSNNETPSESAGPKTVEANFMQFLSGMAVQTLIHLGQMAYPGTDRRAVDLPNARYSIDLLAILQEKTKGNLTEEEGAYLSHVLRDLRAEYIRAAEKKRDEE